MLTLTTLNTDVKIVKTELYDPDVMDVLCKDVQSFSKRDLGNLSRYKKGRKHANQVEVVYHFGKGCEENQLGRLYPHDGQGLQSFPFDMRNPLLEKNYWDIDMENAHYNILYTLADTWGLKTNSIRHYIDNRDIELAKVSSVRHIAKTAFLKVAYGGSIKLYNEHYNDDGIAPEGDITLLRKIEVEMKAIVDLCWTRNEQYHKLVKKKENPRFSLFALILQTEERKCLLAIDQYLQQNGRQMDIYIHDGGEVRKLENETDFPPHLLRGAEQYIKDQVGYSLTLINKPFKHSFKLPSDIKSYETIKKDFELSHFKLMKPLSFVRVQNKELQMLSKSDINIMYENLYYENTSQFTHKWLGDTSIRTYERLVFEPMREIEPNEFNIFQGFQLEPCKGDISAVHEVLNIISNHKPEIFNYIECAMANILQKPYNKLGVCIIVQSPEEGAGKDTYFDLIGRILGKYFMNTSSAENILFSKFNGCWKDKLMLKMEELNFLETKTHADKFKALITADSLDFQNKGQDQITLSNFTTFVGTTNNDVPVVLGDGARRFALFRASAERVGDHEFWNRIQPILHSKATAEAYMHHLLNLDLSNFKPREFPRDEYFDEVKEAFIPYHARFFQNFIESANGCTEYTWKGNDLISEIKGFEIKFERSVTKIGRDLRNNYVESGIITKKISNGTKYNVDLKRLEEYIKLKKWWYELIA